MTLANFTVEYSLDAVTWTQLDNVQNVSGFVGRRILQDTFEPSSMNVTLRYPTGYASPITALIVGTWIRVKRTGATYEYWRGKIRDVAAEYGIPYLSGVGEADFVNITAEGALAELGRYQGNDQLVTQDLVTYLLSDISTYTNVTIGTTFTVDNSPTLGDYTVSGSWLEYLNLIATSVGATLKDGSGQPGVFTKDFVGTLPAVFSDTANDSTHQIYDQIRFDSLASDYFTGVEVNTESYGTVVASNAPAGQPPRTLRISTINSSTNQATDLALYYLGIYSTPSFGISEISCKAEAQNSMNLEFGYAWYDLPGYRTYVEFRGASYYMTILGCSFDARPDGARYTYYLAAADLTPYFVLDSDEYGILDTNKLSW